MKPSPSFAAAGRGERIWGRGGMTAVWLPCSPPKVLVCPPVCGLLVAADVLCLPAWETLVVGWVWKSQVGAGGRGSGRQALQFVCRVVCGVCRTPCCFCCGPAAGRSISGRTPAPAGCRVHSKNMYPHNKNVCFRPLRGRGPFLKTLKRTKIWKNPGFCGKSPFFNKKRSSYP